MFRRLWTALLLVPAFCGLASASGQARACTIPSTAELQAAFQETANGSLPSSYPHATVHGETGGAPAVLLESIAWVESHWSQYTPSGRPLVSYDFGYGVMQVTSGMAGAYGKISGSLPTNVQDRIASDYLYNIATGAMILAAKFDSTPLIGDGSPDALEHWYYALWAYNGWGWINNPNNPRFTRSGTPETNPNLFPYQERVLYWAAHPPKDRNGNLMWQPVRVSQPSRKSIGKSVAALPELTVLHRVRVPPLDAIYEPGATTMLQPLQTQRVRFRLFNTGSAAWPHTGSDALLLAYHLYKNGADPLQPASPFASGLIQFAAGAVALQKDVLPGRSLSLFVGVTAPKATGTYSIAWDLENVAGTWFSNLGSVPYVSKLQVVSAGDAGGPSPTPTQTVVKRAENLQYVADTSFGDESTVASHQRFTKGWIVYNNGSNPWRAGWALQLRHGAAFGRRTIDVPPLAACHTANILARLIAPKQSKHYVSVWQLQNELGAWVGEKLTLVVNVRGTSHVGTPTPTPPVTPTPTKPTPTPTPIG